MDKETLGLIATLIGGAMASPVSEWIAKKYSATKRKHLNIDFNLAFQAYLQHSVGKYAELKTPVHSNSSFRIDDWYEPLWIRTPSPVPIRSGKEHFTNQLVNEFPAQLLMSYDKLLITDGAGMGKTTLLKYIFVRAVREGRAIPVFVELRYLTARTNLIEYIRSMLEPGSLSLSHDDVRCFLAFPKVLLMLDGYDEIDPSIRENVDLQIHKLLTYDIPKTPCILTTRPSYAAKNWANSYGFSECSIVGLNSFQVERIVTRFSRTEEKSTALLKKLTQSESWVTEFTASPLLVMLLIFIWDFNPKIPPKRSEFYWVLFNALYSSHDLSKDGGFERIKLSQLGLTDFHRFLRYFAISGMKRRKIEFTDDEALLEMIPDALSSSGLSADPANMLSDLTVAVPLMIREGMNIRWSHRSLQEYFAAGYVHLDSNEWQVETLNSIWHSKSLPYYMGTLELLLDIDRDLVIRTLVLPTLENFISRSKSAYLGDYQGVSEQDISMRRDVTLGSCFYLIFTDGASRLDPNPDIFLAQAEHDFPELRPLVASRRSVMQIAFDANGRIEGRRKAAVRTLAILSYSSLHIEALERLLYLVEPKSPVSIRSINIGPTYTSVSQYAYLASVSAAPIREDPQYSFNDCLRFSGTTALCLKASQDSMTTVQKWIDARDLIASMKPHRPIDPGEF